MIARRQFMCLAGAVASLAGIAPLDTMAQSNLINAYVGFAPGGPGEVLVRQLAGPMQKELGKTIVVNNKPGAAGVLAVMAVKGGPTDGSALLYGPPGPFTTFPLVYKKLQYDPAEIEAAARICEFDFALAVKADHPAKTLKEFAEWAKKQPNGALYGTVALGSIPHFVGYRFGRDVGVKITAVPYKGAKEIVGDLLGGVLPSGINVTAAFAQEHKAGTLRVLATSGSKRSSLMPDVPTFAEAGYPDIVAVESFGFFVPKGTSAAVKDKVFQAVKVALTDKGVLGFMGKVGFEPAPATGSEYQAALDDSMNRWGPVIKESKFQIE